MNVQQASTYLNQRVNSANLLEKDPYSIILCPEFKFKLIGDKFCNGIELIK